MVVQYRGKTIFLTFCALILQSLSLTLTLATAQGPIIPTFLHETLLALALHR